MNADELEAVLRRTLDDGRLSRGERRVLQEIVAEQDLDHRDIAILRARAFDLARESAGTSHERGAVDWLEDVVKALATATDDGASAARSEAWFSPGDACRQAICRSLDGCRARVDICVFTITDDRVTDAILAAHRRGVAVRVITDDDKAHDAGSDVHRLADAGVPVAVDESDKHMHHKFAVFDGAAVLTGSYNWTRSAAHANEENVVLSGDRRIVRAFVAEFEKLWRRFRKGER